MRLFLKHSDAYFCNFEYYADDEEDVSHHSVIFELIEEYHSHDGEEHEGDVESVANPKHVASVAVFQAAMMMTLWSHRIALLWLLRLDSLLLCWLLLCNLLLCWLIDMIVCHDSMILYDYFYFLKFCFPVCSVQDGRLVLD